MNEYINKIESIVSKIDVADVIILPEERGLYIYKCEESDNEWAFASVYEVEESMIVCEEGLGETSLDIFCNGLTELLWVKVA